MRSNSRYIAKDKEVANTPQGVSGRKIKEKFVGGCRINLHRAGTLVLKWATISSLTLSPPVFDLIGPLVSPCLL